MLSKKVLTKFLVILGSHFAQMISVGMSVSFGILYREIRTDFDTSQAEAAWVASIFNAFIGFVGFPLSIVTPKIGERWVTVAGSIVLATGMGTSYLAKEMSTLYVTYGLLGGLGAGIVHYCGNTILGPHFDDKWRPIAMASGSAGIPVGILVFPPVMTALIQTFDWRKTFLVLGGVSLLGVPAGLAFCKPKSESNNDHEDITPKPADNQTLKKSLRRLFRNADYILYFAATISVWFVLFAPATFLPDLMHEFHMNNTQVSACVMTLGLGDLLGRLIFGYISHKFTKQTPLIHSAGLLLFAGSAAAIIFARSFVSFIILSALIGLGSGGFNGLHAVMAAHLVDTEDLRKAYGIAINCGGFAILAGMPFAGFVTDSFKSERWSFVVSGGFLLIASMLTFVIKMRSGCGFGKKASFDLQEVEVEVQIETADIKI